MSSFKGNALRGTFFLVFGLGWSVKYPLKYLSRTLNADSQASRWIQKLDILEGAAKAFLAVAGMLAEQFVPDGPHMGLYSGETYSWEKLTNWQYTTMYLFYGLSGIVDVLSYSPLKLSLGLDRLLLSVAMFTEGFLFCFHDYNNTALDQHLHSLLLIAIFGGALCALIEVFLRDHTILEFFRTSFFILQGSWFWQIGFVLSPPWGGPGWDQTDRGNFKFLTMCFFWHYAAALLVTAANSVFSYWYRKACQANFGNIDVELDCGFCLRKTNQSPEPVLLPEDGLDEK
ncbi:transmembrane protein 45B-like [Terrapene carolina triunguis]|uniref:transmembrane protein 45B-like n=1 Tax=Terrapene triunguis TaxID=2587831 RepID=UPI000E77E763|nr:transmembrane protein 45B-like [Terrapene carolina triunguis]